MGFDTHMLRPDAAYYLTPDKIIAHALSVSEMSGASRAHFMVLR